MNNPLTLLIGSIGENNRYIKTLLKEKSQKINEVQSIMDQKARTKTPLNERQQRTIHEFSGVYAREGGILQQSLMNMESTLRTGLETPSVLHNQDTEAFLQSLMMFHSHQRHAIHSLRRMIASSENTLNIL